MINYNHGKIYRIVPNCEHDPHEIYIGSTTKKYLSQRMADHILTYRRYKNGKRGLTTSFILFDKYGIDNCSIILLELVNANSKDELLKRERFHIENIKCVNKYVPLRSGDEYYKANKEIINKRHSIMQKTRIESSPLIQCLCGSTHKECYTYHHLRTKGHLAYINM